jgi:hypothetical protein
MHDFLDWERPLIAAMRYVQTTRLVPTGRGKERDLLLTAESMVASAHVSCALLVVRACTERGAWSTRRGGPPSAAV